MSSIPSTMRAWVYHTAGAPSKVVKLQTNIKAPQPADLGPDDVLVEVQYTAFNGGSSLFIQTLRPRPLAFFIQQKDRMGIAELEFGGRMVAVGRDVLAKRPDLKIGELVIGSLDPIKMMRHGVGALTEYVITSTDYVFPYQVPGGEKPTLSLAEWAGLGGVGCTAVQVIDRAGIKAGDKVLVNGGSGGAGVMMLQVARSVIGPTGRLVSTCSGRNVELVKSLGVDEVIDYQESGPLHAYLAASQHSTRPFDAIVDCVGIQDLFTHSPSYLAAGKKFINIGAMDSELSLKGLLKWVWLGLWNQYCPTIFGGVPRSYEFYSAKPDARSVDRLRKLIQDGELKQVVDSIWEFEDVPKAYEIMESKRARGKILVHVRD